MADEFDTAFAQFASPETDKKPDEAAAAASGDGGAAAGGAGDGQGSGAAAGDGSGSADAGADAGAGAAAGGDQAAAAAGADAGAAGAGAADDGKAGEAAAGAAAAGSDGGAAGDDKGAAAADAGKAGAAPAAADQSGNAGPSADDILAGLKKLVGDAGKAEPAAAAGGDQAGAAEKPVYTQEEQDRLAKYDDDWKEVAECEALKRRAEYQALLNHVFTQVANFVKPIQETAEALAQRTFTSDVKGAVPDYSDQLRAEVIDWVKSQPTYLQVAYNHVIEEGTVDEVKDLVDRYRTATGKAAPNPAGAGGAASKASDKGNELSDQAKQAAAALAPVDSKRSGVQAPSDPSNFDDAWKEAAGLG